MVAKTKSNAVQPVAEDPSIGSSILLTTRQAAEHLAICERKVFELLASGSIPKVKIGRSLRITRADLERFISDSKIVRR